MSPKQRGGRGTRSHPGDGDATRGQPPSPKARCRPGAVTGSQMSQLVSPCPCQPWGRARRCRVSPAAASPGDGWAERHQDPKKHRAVPPPPPPPRSTHGSPPVPSLGDLAGCGVPDPGATRCHTVPRGATRCHAFWGPTWGRLVAAQHQVGRRRSAPADLERGGHSRDPRLHPKSCPPPPPQVPKTSPSSILVPLASSRRWPRGDAGRRALPGDAGGF